jgi:hypothetical protein
MSANPQPEPDRLEAATDQAIAACGGDARAAVKALIVANEFLESEVCELPCHTPLCGEDSRLTPGEYHDRSNVLRRAAVRRQ